MGQTVIELIENSEGRQELWQWDLGRKVKVVPSEGITVDEVHFGNVFSGEALVVEPKVDETTGDIVANVPNILATQFFSINVYAVMLIPDGKITTERVILDVTAREKPSDYVYTETEIKNYDALEKRIKALEENGGSGGNGKPGADGFSPSAKVEETAEGAVITITDKEGTTEASVRNGKDGSDGKDGENGKDGTDGKSAYQYAQDGGYTGTEEEFAQKMAKELPTKLSELENDLELEVEGTVEITDGEPTKESTVLTVNPNADEVNLYTAEEIDAKLQNLPSAGTDLDVQINGESIVENGVATIPLASKDAFGVAKIYPSGDKNAPGVGMSGNNILTIVQATTGNIDGRVSQKAITSNNIDYAVKCAMTDGKGAEWTAEEKASARERIDAVSNFKLLGEINITEEVAEVVFDGFEVDDIYVYTKGLKTNKSSSVGCYLKLNDNIQTASLAEAMYTSNVFNAITTQEGFALVSEVGNGYKFKISTPKPDMELNVKEIKAFGSLCEQVGKITKVTIASSEASSYPFSGGLIRLFGR